MQSVIKSLGQAGTSTTTTTSNGNSNLPQTRSKFAARHDLYTQLLRSVTFDGAHFWAPKNDRDRAL
jgi:hypothetical protein